MKFLKISAKWCVNVQRYVFSGERAHSFQQIVRSTHDLPRLKKQALSELSTMVVISHTWLFQFQFIKIKFSKSVVLAACQVLDSRM